MLLGANHATKSERQKFAGHVHAHGRTEGPQARRNNRLGEKVVGSVGLEAESFSG
jgi:hypothetical protein